MSKIKNTSYIFIAVILIFIAGGIILSYFCNKKEAIPAPSILKEENKKEALSENKTPATPAPIPAPPEVWETYTNDKLGFSIKYPEMVYGVYRCSPQKPFYVPLKIFEDEENNMVFITQEYYYNNWDSKLQNNTGLCEKITYSLKSLREDILPVPEFTTSPKPWLGLAIMIKNINNDIGLDEFIKDTYGSGCFMESKNFWQQRAGVYEIKLNGFKDAKGNNTDLGSAVCPVNYVYKILYTPEKSKVMSVNLGQECQFATDYDSENYECYDEEMINSFQFK